MFEEFYKKSLCTKSVGFSNFFEVQSYSLVEDVVSVFAALLRCLHDFFEMIYVKPLRHFCESYLQK